MGAWLSGWEIRTKASEAVEDELYAKVLAFSDGRSDVVLISTDLIGVTADIVRRVREKVEKETGAPGGNVMISASHTHFGPVIRVYKKSSNPDLVDQGGPDPRYIDSLVDKLSAAVKEARSNMQAARVGTGKGAAPKLLFNRRTKRPDGKVTMTFVLPPAEEGLTFGPVDPEVGVLRVEDNSGRLIGSLINFACHPVVGGGHGTGWESWFYHISADYPGYATGVVEAVEGGVCLFTLGTAGDMVPSERGVRPRFEIGRSLGGEALRALQFVETSDQADIRVIRREIKLPLKRQQDKDSLAELDPAKSEITSEIQGIRIGGAILVGLPGEVLVELGLDLKKRAGWEGLFLISLANDAIGYICHEAAFEEGGYEPERGSVLAPGAGEMMVEAALQVISELRNET